MNEWQQILQDTIAFAVTIFVGCTSLVMIAISKPRRRQ